MISKMILSSNQLGCSDEIITIAAILSIQVRLFGSLFKVFFFLSLVVGIGKF
jgi:HrpA-like RNA helicase